MSRNLLILTKEIQMALQSQVPLECSLAKFCEPYQSFTGLVLASDRPEDKGSVALISSPSKIDDKGEIFVAAINLSDNQTTPNIQTQKAHLKILSEAQSHIPIESDPQLFSLA